MSWNVSPVKAVLHQHQVQKFLSTSSLDRNRITFCALAWRWLFRRARLQSVYAVLRGKDMETDAFSPARRDEQFAKLQQASDKSPKPDGLVRLSNLSYAGGIPP